MSNTSLDSATGPRPVPCPRSDSTSGPTMAEAPSSCRAELGREHKETWPDSGSPASGQAGSQKALSLDDFLARLLTSGLLTIRELEQFLDQRPLLRSSATDAVISALMNQGLLTEYQVGRLLSGHIFGLVLGNYRTVERLGAGGMGVVYKAEHIHMKRTVAIKVLVGEADPSSVFLQRFYSEMQATAVLSHPNIVLAFDAGELPVPESRQEVLRYLVMEYVPGKDLEQYVIDNGPLPIKQACDYIRQAASGLQHAYEHGLVHRDIKPSNLLLTPQNQVKILDFGLARVCRRRHTEAHIMLGSVDYMAPEQARDARSADIRADIYALGGTLYWLLSGKKPFPGDRAVIEELLARQRESPPPLRNIRPEIPHELEAVVCQMMAINPGDRYSTPLAVMSAVSAFLEPAGSSRDSRPSTLIDALGLTLPQAASPVAGDCEAPREARRVLLVCDSPKYRQACRAALAAAGPECLEAHNAEEAKAHLSRQPIDLVLIDAQLPDGCAVTLTSHLRLHPPAPHAKLILVTPENTPPWLTAAQSMGADDCVPKSILPEELANRVRAMLRIKEAEDRADCQTAQALTLGQQLELTQRLRDADLYQAQEVLIFAMAKMAELRGLETSGHLLRMQAYVRALAEEAARLPAFKGRIDDVFVRMLERGVLLHDIGKVAIPDHILLKPGKLEPEERSVMESHTVVGGDILLAVARQHGASSEFLQVATELVRHHHERYDGAGYPDGLAGEAIPLPARIVAIADVYDALRSKLVYKPGLAHPAARRLILESTHGQFDPGLLVAFQHCEASLEQIFAQTRD